MIVDNKNSNWHKHLLRTKIIAVSRYKPGTAIGLFGTFTRDVYSQAAAPGSLNDLYTGFQFLASLASVVTVITVITGDSKRWP
jgi:hypothetical protein